MRPSRYGTKPYARIARPCGRQHEAVAKSSLFAGVIYASRVEGAEGRDTDDPGMDVREVGLSFGLQEAFGKGVTGLAHCGLNGWEVERCNLDLPRSTDPTLGSARRGGLGRPDWGQPSKEEQADGR